MAYSQGFNPRPRFQIAAALPVGVTGRAELLDVWLIESLVPGGGAGAAAACPAARGLEVLDVVEVDLRGAIPPVTDARRRLPG